LSRGAAYTALAGVGALFVLHAVYLAVVAEDAFITFHYSTHLAGGHGLVWNLGSVPVEGYTNFLWVVVCAAAIALGIEVTRFAQVVGVVAGLATIVYTWRFAERILRVPRPLSVVPCVLLAASGPFATWASSGMETALFTLLVTAGCYHAAACWNGKRGHAWGAAVLFVAATLTRPEGPLVGVIAAAATVWVMGPRGALRHVGAVALYIGVLAVYEAWRVSYFHAWLPNTFYAKVGGSPFRVVRGAVYAAAFAAYFVVPFAPLAVLAGKTASRAERWRERLRRHSGATLCAVVCLVYGAYVVWAGGDYMAMYRFFVPVLPLFYLFCGALYAGRRAWERANGRSGAWSASFLALGLAITAIHSTPVDRYLFPKPPLQHGSYVGVQTERWHVARLSLIGRFFRDYSKSGDESVATPAIGAISYYSGIQVFGFHGLVDPTIAHRRARGKHPGLGLPGHEKGDMTYILSLEPTYVMIHRKFTPEPAGYPSDIDVAAEHELEREYEPVSVWLDDAVNGESGYFTFYQRRER